MLYRIVINKNALLATRGIVYCRCSAGFKVLALIKVCCNLIRNRFEIGNKPYRRTLGVKYRPQHHDCQPTSKSLADAKHMLSPTHNK